jgi:hypothetical protein
MTPERRRALQWFHDRGEVGWFRFDEKPPSDRMKKQMMRDGQLQTRKQGDWKPLLYSLTDKGRQDLHEDTP